jgi:hypothetical protein
MAKRIEVEDGVNISVEVGIKENLNGTIGVYKSRKL